MNRRTFLATAAAAALTGAAGAQQGGRRRPNVLIVMADQHKRSCMGAYGDPVAKTPNLDRLAAQGMTFTDAHSTSAVCSPSRKSA